MLFFNFGNAIEYALDCIVRLWFPRQSFSIYLPRITCLRIVDQLLLIHREWMLNIIIQYSKWYYNKNEQNITSLILTLLRRMPMVLGRVSTWWFLKKTVKLSTAYVIFLVIDLLTILGLSLISCKYNIQLMRPIPWFLLKLFLKIPEKIKI